MSVKMLKPVLSYCIYTYIQYAQCVPSPPPSSLETRSSRCNYHDRVVEGTKPIATIWDHVRLGHNSHLNAPLCHALEQQILSSGTVVYFVLRNFVEGI